VTPRESQAPSPRNDRFGGSDKFGHKEDRWGERGGFRDRSDRPDRGDRDRGDKFDRMDRSIERNDRRGNDRLERRGDTDWRGGGFNNSRSSSFRERRSEEKFGNHHNSVRKYDTRPLPESKAENSNNIRAVTTDTGTSPPVRKKLELKPRSSTAVPNETATPRSSKPNPFGEAKPIDTDEALRRVEERRKQKEKEQKEKEENKEEMKENTSKNDDNTTVTTENGNA
jgi:translation initiation factor 4B